MIDSDIKNFADMLDSISEYYDKKPVSIPVCKLYFASLINFDLGQISAAITRHIESPGKYNAFPKIADFKRILEGGEVTPDMIIAAAKLKRSPLGILARIHIGTWDLNNLGSFDLKQRAIECQELMGEWQERVSNGEYSDHEISIMIKHDVDPAAPFTNGISGPKDLPALAERIQRLTGDTRHNFLLGNDQEELGGSEKQNPEQIAEIRQKIKDMLNPPKVDKPKPDMSEPNGT